jgi:hypothetical protein
VFEAVLIIHPGNGGSLFLTLESKANAPAFQSLHDHKKLFILKTDGCSIYWQDSPRLTFNEIIEMLRGRFINSAKGDIDGNLHIYKRTTVRQTLGISREAV